MRSSAFLNVENKDEYCFIWSILVSHHPCINNFPNRVSNYKQYFNELNINCFDFSNGFKCSDVHKLIELINLSFNIFELNFCQHQNKWKQKLIPIEVSKIESDKVIDFLIYKNH